MKAKRINKIQNLGVFHNFAWNNAIPEFGVYNILYGWNYSGKTTLSRIFRCIELNTIHPDYPNALFELELSDGSKLDQTFSSRLQVRVFNSDFCRDNLKWDSDDIEPIFMLGEENVELQGKLKELRIELEKYTKESGTIKENINIRSNQIESALTTKARSIGELYAWRPFTKTQFRSYVDDLSANPISHQLDEQNFNIHRQRALSSDVKQVISLLTISVGAISPIQSEVSALLRRSVVGKKITELLAKPEVASWVEKGYSLHKEIDECLYCKNKISNERLTELNQHFSDEYQKLKDDGNALYVKLKGLIIHLSVENINELGFYSDLADQARNIKLQLIKEIRTYNDSIEKLLNDLVKKSANPFEILNATDANDNSTAINSLVQSLNSLVEQNNSRTNLFDKERNYSINLLKYHYAAEFVIETNYTKVIAQNVDATKDLENRSVIEIEKGKAILDIEKKLSETVRAAEKVNFYLNLFFGKDDIRIESTSEQKFKLVRGTSVARNLSEGERTAISFAYFATKLEEKGSALADSLIYIDDPISSLDSNHFFNVYSLIKYLLWDVETGATKCKQLFVSTHNYEFYNLIRMVPKENPKKGYRQLYLVERKNTNGDSFSTLLLMPKQMAEFKSEYLYFFNIIHKFRLNPSISFEHLFNLPNTIRRFLEVYLNFKYISPHNIDTDIDKLIPDHVNREKLRKFVHYHSHALSTGKLREFPPIEECSEVVEILLISVERQDPVHYQSLLKEVQELIPTETETTA